MREETIDQVRLFDIFTPDETASMIEGCERKADWINATFSSGEYDAEVRKSQMFAEHSAPEVFSCARLKLSRFFADLLNISADGQKTSLYSFQMLRYEVGGHYVAHRDSGPEFFRERRYSIVCYLNDDFEGGETHFVGLNKTIEPQAGAMLLFPSFYIHAAQKVVKGTKYVLTSYLNREHVE